jgi:phytanoyl-CoA hydroxylase
MSSCVQACPVVKSPEVLAHRTGTWADQPDAFEQLLERVGDGRVSAGLVAPLTNWITEGFVILPKAVPREVSDQLGTELAAAWREGHPDQIVFESQTGVTRPLVAGDETRLTRAVDSHVHFASAQTALAAPMITSFLAALFDADPLYFASLVFEVGSEQGLHQDTAFVVVDQPLQMVGVWFALQDVAAGSGELRYVPGSHRLPTFYFDEQDTRRYYDPTVDSRSVHDDYYAKCAQRCDDAGMITERFLPQAGDVLIWAAELVHGGSPITDRSLTRRSMVVHACPQTANPHFYSYLPGNRVTKALPASQARYASQYHMLGAD